jgi:hypothetical protein
MHSGRDSKHLRHRHVCPRAPSPCPPGPPDIPAPRCPGSSASSPDTAIAFLHAPDGFAATLGALPADVAVGLREGMVDVKVCAIDAVWSGLRFVYRLADRR